MTPKILPRSPPVNRRQPLLTGNPQSTLRENKKGRCGEVAGGTAAECAAVCCCCPCSIVNLLVLAVYKLPIGLCRKVWSKEEKKRRKMIKNSKVGLLLKQRQSNAITTGGITDCDCNGKSTAEIKVGMATETVEEECGTTEAADLEKEMWKQFYGTGFWRSPSQRES